MENRDRDPVNLEVEAEKVVPVMEEELITGTRAVKTGSIRVRKEVERIGKKIEMPAVRDVVRVTRVQVNRRVDAIPEIREEGDILIVPVVEEELVVEKRLVLREEIRIERRRTKGVITRETSVRREHAVVERLDQEGNITATSRPESAPAEPRIGEQERTGGAERRTKSLLK